MKEIWKKAPGHPLYEVSDQGRIRSWCNNRWGKRKTPKIIGTSLDVGHTGYHFIQAKTGGGHRKQFVHRLVLLAFVGKPKKGLICRHLNGIKTDNRLVNLKWDTMSENIKDIMRHSDAVGRPRHWKLTLAKLKEVRELCKRDHDCSDKSHYRKIAAQYGVCLSVVYNIAKGKTFSYI